MWRRGVQLLGVIALLLAGMLIALFVGMRTKNPAVLRTVRRFNRSVGNPRMMESAGQPGAYAAVIRHVGRTTGKAYETPIGPIATPDGFIVPLVYGTTPDWLKNIQKAGTATIISEGIVYRVDRPEIIDNEDAMPHIPEKDQRALRWFKVEDFLLLRHVESPE